MTTKGGAGGQTFGIQLSIVHIHIIANCIFKYNGEQIVHKDMSEPNCILNIM